MGPVKTFHLTVVLSVVALAASPTATYAQDPPSASASQAESSTTWQGQAPAHISVVDGVAILERDGQQDASPGNMPLLAGDRVRTRVGRVEILFADGSTLHLDHNSAIDLQSDELIRMLEGRIRLSIPGPAREVAYRVDGPFGWTQVTEPGDYRIALLNGPRGAELELAVLRGRAELVNEGGTTPLRAGERAFARAGAAPSYAYVFNSAAYDAFDRWSEARRDARLSQNAEYLPDEVRPYATSFEQYGYWSDEPSYGRVWYPRVGADWRPYYRGRWVVLRPYGWTWVAHDPWGWPTHHYGRWGFGTAGWYWIPGRTWGAAWVSWGYAPNYVSWCPLGWNNRPVFGININFGHGYHHWRGWTVIPKHRFGHGYVHHYNVRGDRLDYSVRTSFAHRERAPEIVGRAIPRGTAPISLAGTQSARRGGTPLITNLPAERARITSDGQRVRMPPPQRPVGAAPAVSRAVPRERMVPDRPAVRSDRPSASRSDLLDPTLGRRSVEAQRSIEQPRAVPGQRAVPRDSDRRGPMSSPGAGQTPGYRRDPGSIDRSVSPQIPRSEPSPSYEPQRRAVPRGDAGRPSAPEYRAPSGIERSRPPSIERAPDSPGIERRNPSGPAAPVGRAVERGPDRPSAGSYERRGPAPSSQPSSPPSAGSGSSRSSSPSGGLPAGARPRPSGGGRGGR